MTTQPETHHNYDDEIEITDCQICGCLLPESLICGQCEADHTVLKELLNEQQQTI